MINKRELAARLKQGECLEEIFDFTDGQECLIYKENLKYPIILFIFLIFILIN